MTEQKKIKVFVISDHPFAPSGVGTQTKYVIETLLKTGRYQFVCFGGAVEHQDYTPQKTEQWGDDLVVFPVPASMKSEIFAPIPLSDTFP